MCTRNKYETRILQNDMSQTIEFDELKKELFFSLFSVFLFFGKVKIFLIQYKTRKNSLKERCNMKFYFSFFCEESEIGKSSVDSMMFHLFSISLSSSFVVFVVMVVQCNSILLKSISSNRVLGGSGSGGGWVGGCTNNVQAIVI